MKGELIVLGFMVLAAAAATLDQVDGEVSDEDDHDVLVRNDRGAKNKACRYTKNPWSDCDPTTNTRSRTLTLKKGSDESTCQSTKTVQKKCKRACRYEKGTWGECNQTTNQMIRTDKLKDGSDDSCQTSRQITKRCKAQKKKASAKCKYEKLHSVAWGECDEETRVTHKVRNLKKGDPKICPKQKITSRPCKVKTGSQEDKKKREGKQANKHERQ